MNKEKQQNSKKKSLIDKQSIHKIVQKKVTNWNLNDLQR